MRMVSDSVAAPKPFLMYMLSFPLLRLKPAAEPMATFADPVVRLTSVLSPKAEFWMPSMLDLSAVWPKAEFCAPVVFALLEEQGAARGVTWDRKGNTGRRE